MKIEVLSHKEINESVANKIIELVNNNKNAILGLATGSTPIGVYDELAKANKEGKVSFKTTRTFNLDEYVGLDGNDDQSYRYFMNKNLFTRIDIDLNNTNVPSGKGDIELLAKQYDEKIAEAGGIDFQILGIGCNGHIAFNEPGTSFESLTHVTGLTESTINANARFFAKKEDVPTSAVTMGLASIMKAKEIVLIATGKSKAEAIKKLVEDEPDESLPCSILKNHPNVTIYVDEEAYSLVK